jgi:hypothetical protein
MMRLLSVPIWYTMGVAESVGVEPHRVLRTRAIGM